MQGNNPTRAFEGSGPEVHAHNSTPKVRFVNPPDTFSEVVKWSIPVTFQAPRPAGGRALSGYASLWSATRTRGGFAGASRGQSRGGFANPTMPAL